MPGRPPTAHRENDVAAWAHTKRAIPAPGIFGYAHTPRPPYDPNRVSNRQLLRGAVLSLIAAFVVWWVVVVKDVGPVWWIVFKIAPDSLQPTDTSFVFVSNTVYLVTAVLILALFKRSGRWGEIYRRFLKPLGEEMSTASTPVEGDDQQSPPTAWPRLRQAGQYEAAERLDAELRAGRMNDVDYARLTRAWEGIELRPDRTHAFVEAVRRHGAGACAHPSGSRDLPVRTARHDLVTRQVRIGAAPDQEKNPWAHRGAGIALDPGLLGTSLLLVGPPGSGKTRRIIRPVVEAMCLQALSGTACVVAVGSADADLGPNDSFDVVIALGDPESAYDLDLYGGAVDPDEAAACLAEALLPEGEVDSRRAQTALSQVIGPFHAAHGRYPAVSELRELLDGTPTALAMLREALDEAGAHGHQRELDARRRLHGRPDDVGPLLADRVALLTRPAFAGFFDVSGRGRPFSLRALEHPLRVRIALPARAHAEACRIIARLVLAQFAASVAARADRSLFTCLVLDDAAHAVSAQTVRDLQRLRSGNAGVVLGLRTLDDVPESLRTALLGAVGCQMALSGVTTWDGKRFAEAWGTTWVDESAVTRTPDRSGGALRRGLRLARKLVTGEAATTESITVRQVERERWSASELAHSVPPGHAVLSLTTASGEHVPPVLVNLLE
nr:ATP-binding protein [Wenjunlia tyrosinilytica]